MAGRLDSGVAFVVAAEAAATAFAAELVVGVGSVVEKVGFAVGQIGSAAAFAAELEAGIEGSAVEVLAD